MPNLPAVSNFWTPEPDMYVGAEAWILAGGAHHTAFTYDLSAEQMGDWANAMGIEFGSTSIKAVLFVRKAEDQLLYGWSCN